MDKCKNTIHCRSPPIDFQTNQLEENIMGYNKASELRKWIRWKKDEEKILRYFGFSDKKIKALYDFDMKQFNSDRRFREKQVTNSDLINNVGTTYLNLPLNDFHDVLDQLEDMKLYSIVSKVDIQTMAILFLKIHGYSNKDISKVLGLSESLIRKRIYSVRKKLKK